MTRRLRIWYQQKQRGQMEEAMGNQMHHMQRVGTTGDCGLQGEAQHPCFAMRLQYMVAVVWQVCSVCGNMVHCLIDWLKSDQRSPER